MKKQSKVFLRQLLHEPCLVLQALSSEYDDGDTDAFIESYGVTFEQALDALTELKKSLQ